MTFDFFSIVWPLFDEIYTHIQVIFLLYVNFLTKILQTPLFFCFNLGTMLKDWRVPIRKTCFFQEEEKWQ